MNFDEEQEKPLGRFESRGQQGPAGHVTGRFAIYCFLHFAWILVSLAFGFFSYDLIKNNQGINIDSSFTAGLFSFTGCAATFFAVVSVIIAWRALLNLRVTFSN
jgi:hypothetical protein